MLVKSKNAVKDAALQRACGYLYGKRIDTMTREEVRRVRAHAAAAGEVVVKQAADSYLTRRPARGERERNPEEVRLAQATWARVDTCVKTRHPEARPQHRKE